MLQFSEIVPGETLAELTTSMGVITLRFFPGQAPKTVENFLTHAKNGYYDGVLFHRVIDDFMIQCGDPTGTGAGGESIWGRPFADEFSDELFNFRGALSMANRGSATNGSQFFIVQTTAAKGLSPSIPAAALAHYRQVGGTPYLDGKHTVFGHVVSGMEVVDAIAAAPADHQGRPSHPITIQTIKIYTK